MRFPVGLLLAAFLASQPCLPDAPLAAADAPAPTPGFETPAEVARNETQAGPGASGQIVDTFCHHYPTCTIKVVSDRGDVGVRRISVLPASSGRSPACRPEPEAGEQVLGRGLSNIGTFEGLAGDYAVFGAAEGATGGGAEFWIFRLSDQALVFHDIAQASGSGRPLLRIALEPGGLRFAYVRNFEAAECSVPAQGRQCAEKIAAMTGLADNLEQLCSRGYDAAFLASARLNGACSQQESAAECAARHAASREYLDLKESPTSVSYPVEAFVPNGAEPFAIDDGARMQARASAFLTRQGDALGCRPFD